MSSYIDAVGQAYKEIQEKKLIDLQADVNGGIKLDQETAVQSLSEFSIPDENRESTWKFQEMYQDYINAHAKQDADRLNGAYGIKDGVSILPESRGSKDIDVKALPVRDATTGEDSEF